MSENKHAPVAYLSYAIPSEFTEFRADPYLTFERPKFNYTPLYSAKTVEQLESENAGLRKQRLS